MSEPPTVSGDDAIIATAFKWSIAVFVLVALVVVVVVVVVRRPERAPVVIERVPVEAPPVLDQTSADVPEVVFTDITTGAGVTFVHASGATGEKLLPETMGGGVAFLDYDGDGDQDLLLASGTDWPHTPAATRRTPPPTPALYRNDGRGRFEDVTVAVGLDRSFYGMGVACGDYDGDGYVDVYLTALGRNRLFRNAGGVFEEVTDIAGVAGAPTAWSTSAGFFDYDNDDDLDLFVCTYVRWSREVDLRLDFTLNGTDRAYGPPTQYEGDFCVLYRNDGGGVFTDVSAASGIEVTGAATGAPVGKALAVTFADVDDDGWLDVFVANDTVRNFLFRNRRDGRFEEVGAVSGVAFDAMGAATGAMGMDAGDIFGDGRLAVAIGNFANEASSLYVQQPRDPWQFADMAGAEGVGSPSRLKLSFGLLFLDYDLDGRLDLLQANGHLEDEINAIQPSQHYRQPAQLFWNCGPDARACFAAVDDVTVGDLARPIVGRGAAYADIDGDGDLDLALTQVGGPALLLRNEHRLGHRWVRLRLAGRGGNRGAIGARVELTAGGTIRRRRVMPTRSYLSQVELPVTLGLGDAESVESVRIVWPDGRVQVLDDVPLDTLTTVDQPG